MTLKNPRRLSSIRKFGTLVQFPSLLKEWNRKKNKNLNPKDYSVNSSQIIWWKCKDCGYEWQQTICNRTRQPKCKKCYLNNASKRVQLNNLKRIGSFAKKNPHLIKEWHKKKNIFSPYEISATSAHKVWWVCKDNKKHIWQTVANQRSITSTRKPTGCPFCINKKAIKDESVGKLFPDLIKEWDFEKNNINPYEIPTGSKHTVWWKCKLGHKYRGIVSNRTLNNTGCKICNQRFGSSNLEIRIYSELKYFFPIIFRRFMFAKRKEADIFIPLLNLVIEVDGYYWHKNSVKKDTEKNKFFKKKKIKIIRIRELGLKKLSKLDISSEFNHDLNIVLKLISRIQKECLLNKRVIKKIDNYLKIKKFINKTYYKKIISEKPNPPYLKSASNNITKLSNKWDFKKNNPITPEMISYGSNEKYWWICKNNHSFLSSVAKIIIDKRGCPYCAGTKVSNKNSLKVIFPQYFKEFDTKKNIHKYEELSYGSHKRVWWQCKKNHSFSASPNARFGKSKNGKIVGCPYCGNKIASKENNLMKLHPLIAKEWNFEKNKKLILEHQLPSSHRIVWWKCKNSHVWKEKISTRIHINRSGNYKSCQKCKKLKLI